MFSLSVAVCLLYLVCGIYTFVLSVKIEKKTGPVEEGPIVLFILLGVIWPLAWTCALFVWLVEKLTKVCNRP